MQLMKNLKKCIYVIGIFFLISCGQKEPEVNIEDVIKEKTALLFDFIKSEQVDSVKTIYPDFDKSYMTLPSDSIQITKVEKNEENGNFVVEVTNFYSENHIQNETVKRSINLTYVKDENDQYFVQKSVGFVDKEALPYEAEASGYLKAMSTASDAEIVNGLSILDDIKTDIIKDRYKRVKENVKIEIWYRTNPGRVFYRIINNSEEFINSVSFKCIYSYEFYKDKQFHNSASVRNLSPNSYKEVSFDLADFSKKRWDWGDAFRDYYVTWFHMVSYNITDLSIDEDILYLGNEYTDYIKKHPNAGKEKGNKNSIPDNGYEKKL